MQIIDCMYPQYIMTSDVSADYITKENYEVINQMIDFFEDPLIIDKCDDLDMISHLIEIGCDWTDEILYNALYDGNWSVFKYAYNNGCPSTDAIDDIYDKILSKFGPNICE